MRGPVAALLVALVLAACGDASYRSCTVLCGPMLACPGGMVCGEDQFCHPPGEAERCAADAASGSDAPMPDATLDASAERLCPLGWQPASYTTDFDEYPLWGESIVDADATVDVTGGFLNLTLPSNEAGGARLGSTTSFDPGNHLLRVKILQPLALDPTAQAYVYLFVDAADSLAVGLDGPTVFAEMKVLGSPMRTMTAYAASEASWWQITDVDGTVVVELSGDGTVWQPFASFSVPLPISDVQLQLVAMTSGEPSLATPIRFDLLLDCVMTQ